MELALCTSGFFLCLFLAAYGFARLLKWALDKCVQLMCCCERIAYFDDQFIFNRNEDPPTYEQTTLDSGVVSNDASTVTTIETGEFTGLTDNVTLRVNGVNDASESEEETEDGGDLAETVGNLGQLVEDMV